MLAEQLKEQTKTNLQLLEKSLVLKMRSMRGSPDYVQLLSALYLGAELPELAALYVIEGSTLKK